MDFTEFGWREGFLLAVVAAVAYLVLSVIRLIRLRRRNVAAAVAPTTRTKPETLATSVKLDAAAAAPMPPFGEHLAWTRLEAEVNQLRVEVAGLREELSELKAARRVSPLYADAVALARRGFDARGIAEECGISVAEAELVLAMSDGSKNFDNEVDDVGSGQGDPIEPSRR
jgi:hypothetical protein